MFDHVGFHQHIVSYFGEMCEIGTNSYSFHHGKTVVVAQ